MAACDGYRGRGSEARDPAATHLGRGAPLCNAPRANLHVLHSSRQHAERESEQGLQDPGSLAAELHPHHNRVPHPDLRPRVCACRAPLHWKCAGHLDAPEDRNRHLPLPSLYGGCRHH